MSFLLYQNCENPTLAAASFQLVVIISLSFQLVNVQVGNLL